MPEFVYSLKFNKGICVGGSVSCPQCVAENFLALPCTIMSNETTVTIDPTRLRENIQPLDPKMCEKQDYSECLKCLTKYLSDIKPCITIGRS